jgi:hypothetical protein
MESGMLAGPRVQCLKRLTTWLLPRNRAGWLRALFLSAAAWFFAASYFAYINRLTPVWGVYVTYASLIVMPIASAIGLTVHWPSAVAMCAVSALAFGVYLAIPVY